MGMPDTKNEEATVISETFESSVPTGNSREIDAPAYLEKFEDDEQNLYHTDYESLEVVPPSKGFENRFMHLMAFSHNFSQFNDQNVRVPEYEAGIEKTESGVEPYFRMRYPGGQNPFQFEENSKEEDVEKMLEGLSKAVSAGYRLSKDHSILYNSKIDFEDFRVRDPTYDEMDPTVYLINPGTYDERRFEQQIEDSPLETDIEEIRKMARKDFWEKALE